jgi:hypothetical protein
MKNTTAPKHSKQTAAARKYEAECEAKRLRVRKYVNRLTAYAPSEWGESCSSTGARLTFRATMILHRIDDAMIGTPDYMGLAYWWAEEYKHHLRAATPAECKRAHDKLIAEGLALDGVSDRHKEIIYKITERSVRKAFGK